MDAHQYWHESWSCRRWLGKSSGVRKVLCEQGHNITFGDHSCQLALVGEDDLSGILKDVIHGEGLSLTRRERHTIFWNMLTSISSDTSFRSWRTAFSSVADRLTLFDADTSMKFFEKVQILLSRPYAPSVKWISSGKSFRQAPNSTRGRKTPTYRQLKLILCCVAHILPMFINYWEAMVVMLLHDCKQLLDRCHIISDHCQVRGRAHDMCCCLSLISEMYGREPGVAAHSDPNGIDAVFTEGVPNPFGGHHANHDRQDMRQCASELEEDDNEGDWREAVRKWIKGVVERHSLVMRVTPPRTAAAPITA